MNEAKEQIRVRVRSDTVFVAGEPAVCDPRGALVFPHLGLLVVSDLHLEKGSAFARRGVMLPPYDTGATLKRLEAVIAEHRPRTVINLGDSFHDNWGPERMPDPYRLALSALMLGRTWYWVAGNHDPKAPAGIGGESVQAISFGPLTFRHEPSKTAMEGEIAGHIHPCARIVQRGRSVRRRCFATDGARMVMPAFGAFTGSMNVLDHARAGYFQRDRLAAYMIGTDRVYLISGQHLLPG